jgi:nucleotide-binding universal stress UspA family protein
MTLGLINPVLRRGLEHDVDFEALSTGRSSVAPRVAPLTILHPTDYSEASQWTFELACRLARNSAGRVIVLHAVPTRRPASLGMASEPAVPRGYRSAWEERLRRQHPPHEKTRIEHRLAEGDAAEEILRVSREQNCNLILMASHVPARGFRLRRGVASVVCRHAPCPVAVLTASNRARSLFFDSEGSGVRAPGRPVSKEAMPGLRSILHPTDFSPGANAAFHLAQSLAQDAGGDLEVVHAAPRPLFYGSRRYREKVEQNLRRMAQSDPALRVWSHVSSGDPVSETVWLAREGLCDLIVLGRRAQPGLKRLWSGSVSRGIQRRVTCPVLTVTVPKSAAAREPRPSTDLWNPELLETGGRS